MVFDISAIAKQEGESINVDSKEIILELKDLLPKYSFEFPVEFQGVLTNVGGSLDVSAKIFTNYRTLCDRCLTEIDGEIDIFVQEMIKNENDNIENGNDVDEYIFKGEQVDVTKIITDAIIMNLPSVSICKEDCLGLCSICGKNRNDFDCGCEGERINPAMEKLKNFFD